MRKVIRMGVKTKIRTVADMTDESAIIHNPFNLPDLIPISVLVYDQFTFMEFIHPDHPPIRSRWFSRSIFVS